MAKPHYKLSLDGEYVPRARATSHYGASLDAPDMVAWRPQRLSADSDLLPDLPDLVGRSRDSDRNNGIARGGVQTILDNVIGTGLRLTARPNYHALQQQLGPRYDKQWAIEWAANVEYWFHSWWWSSACHWNDTLNGDMIAELQYRSKLMNGESITLPMWSDDPIDGFHTKLHTIESDRLSNPDWKMDTLNLRAGIEIDRYGKPLAYHFRDTHPGELFPIQAFAAGRWERIPRKTEFGRLRVIHDFDCERSGQSRGKPLFSPVLDQFKNIDRYVKAEIQAALLNSTIAGTIETDLDQAHIVEMFNADPDKYQIMRNQSAAVLKPGAILPLAPGDKLQPFLPQRQATAFGIFLKNVYRVIAVGADLPYELLMKDFSESNYSNTRAAMLEAWRAFNRRRDRFGSSWFDPIYALFVEELVNDGRIEAPGFYENRCAYLRCKWIGPGRGWVDPVKEAQAAQIRIQAGISTLEDECAEQGRDWRETMDQLQTENMERQERGLMPAPPAKKPGAVDNIPGDEPRPGDEDEDEPSVATSYAALVKALATQASPTINVQPANVEVHTPPVTVNTPAITVNTPPITVQPADINIQPAQVHLQTDTRALANVARELHDSLRERIESGSSAVVETLSAPIEPVYDDAGKLKGARRVKRLKE